MRIKIILVYLSVILLFSNSICGSVYLSVYRSLCRFLSASSRQLNPKKVKTDGASSLHELETVTNEATFLARCHSSF